MGLFKLAVVGGAGYYAVNKYRQNRNKTQNTNPQQQQPPQQQQQQYRDHPYQPDYYNNANTNTFRSADDDMYVPHSEKQRSLYSPGDHHAASYQRQASERPLQLNFVAPSEKTMAQISGANSAVSPAKY